MKAILLIDFGSTYTKVTAVDVEGECLLGTAASYTTVQTDINDGLEKALAILRQQTGKTGNIVFPLGNKENNIQKHNGQNCHQGSQLGQDLCFLQTVLAALGGHFAVQDLLLGGVIQPEAVHGQRQREHQTQEGASEIKIKGENVIQKPCEVRVVGQKRKYQQSGNKSDAYTNEGFQQNPGAFLCGIAGKGGVDGAQGTEGQNKQNFNEVNVDIVGKAFLNPVAKGCVKKIAVAAQAVGIRQIYQKFRVGQQQRRANDQGRQSAENANRVKLQLFCPQDHKAGYKQSEKQQKSAQGMLRHRYSLAE